MISSSSVLRRVHCFLRPTFRAIATLSVVCTLISISGCTVLVEPAQSTPIPTHNAVEQPSATALPAVSDGVEGTTPLPALSPSVGATLDVTVEPTTATTPMPTAELPEATQSDGDEDWDLVYLLNGSVYRGGYWGAEALPVLEAGMPSMALLWRQYLAYEDLSRLYIADLDRGQLHTVKDLPDDPTSSVQFIWASDGRALIYLVSRDDPEAPTFGRSIDISRVDMGDEQVTPLLSIRDRMGGLLLRFDGPDGEFLLLPQGGDPSFAEVLRYDAETGSEKSVLDVEGDGAALASPDGRLLLTTGTDEQIGAGEIRLYDIIGEVSEGAKVATHEAGTHSSSHVWSPDSTQVAFLLRDGRAYWDEVTEGRGIWVLDVGSMEVRKIAEEPDLGSGPVAWTPDGKWVVCYHSDSRGSSYYYALSPDGTEQVLFPLEPQVSIVGWVPSMPGDAGPEADHKTLDDVRDLFRQALSDRTLLLEGSAAFLSLPEVVDMNEGQALAALTSALAQAGWSIPPSGIGLVRLAGNETLLKLPTREVYLFRKDGWQKLIEADLLSDVRVSDDEMGIVFANVAGDSSNPAFVLLRRHSSGGWETLWSPAGQRDWICTDGSIAFAGDGLSRLELVGSSFGLDSGDTEVFSECRECPHRTLRGIWEKSGNEYIRISSLPADAARADRLWEITEPSPYASLYELIRRLRAGDREGARSLAASEEVLEEATRLGLGAGDTRYIVESIEGAAVRFQTAGSSSSFVAELVSEGDRWVLLSVAAAQ